MVRILELVDVEVPFEPQNLRRQKQLGRWQHRHVALSLHAAPQSLRFCGVFKTINIEVSIKIHGKWGSTIFLTYFIETGEDGAGVSFCPKHRRNQLPSARQVPEAWMVFGNPSPVWTLLQNSSGIRGRYRGSARVAQAGSLEGCRGQLGRLFRRDAA